MILGAWQFVSLKSEIDLSPGPGLKRGLQTVKLTGATISDEMRARGWRIKRCRVNEDEMKRPVQRRQQMIPPACGMDVSLLWAISRRVY